jgi:hypothetical protein
MQSNERKSIFLDQPRNMCIRPIEAGITNSWHLMKDIADRRRLNDQDSRQSGPTSKFPRSERGSLTSLLFVLSEVLTGLDNAVIAVKPAGKSAAIRNRQ